MLFVLTIGVFAVGALALANRQTAGVQAQASMVVQDPRSSKVFTNAAYSDPKRYVDDQAAILSSDNVTRRAAMLFSGATTENTSQTLGGTVSILTSATDSRIVIQCKASSASTAINCANSTLTAYQAVKREGATRDLDSTLKGIDQTIADANTQIAAENAKRAPLVGTIAGIDVNSRIKALLDELNKIDGNTTDPTNTRSAALTAQIQALTNLMAQNERSSEVTALTSTIDALRSRVSTLSARRDQLIVDANLGSSGVVLASPANHTDPAPGLGDKKAIAIGLALGAVAGAVLCYAVAMRRRQFAKRLEPEQILGAPLLADVPDFRNGKVDGLVPVVRNPASTAAESLRFAASALSVRSSALGIHTIAISSASIGDGKTTISLNLALALSQAGVKVLLIDADPERNTLTNRVFGEDPKYAGLLDVIAGRITADDAILSVSFGSSTNISVVPIGMKSGELADSFVRPAHIAALAAAAGATIVLLDCPPPLELATAAAFLETCDGTVIVVHHGGSIVLNEELRERLDLLGIPIVGYIYNRSPLRGSVANYYLNPRSDKNRFARIFARVRGDEKS